MQWHRLWTNIACRNDEFSETHQAINLVCENRKGSVRRSIEDSLLGVDGFLLPAVIVDALEQSVIDVRNLDFRVLLTLEEGNLGILASNLLNIVKVALCDDFGAVASASVTHTHEVPGIESKE